MFLSLFCRLHCSIFIFLKRKLLSEYFPTQNLRCLPFPRTKYPDFFLKHSRILQSFFSLFFWLCLSIPVFLNLSEHIFDQSFILPPITFPLPLATLSPPTNLQFKAHPAQKMILQYQVHCCATILCHEANNSTCYHWKLNNVTKEVKHM